MCLIYQDVGKNWYIDFTPHYLYLEIIALKLKKIGSSSPSNILQYNLISRNVFIKG